MSDERLPQCVVDDGLALARGARFMGLPLEDFTRDELLAVAALGWNANRAEVKRHGDELAILAGMRGRR